MSKAHPSIQTSKIRVICSSELEFLGYLVPRRLYVARVTQINDPSPEGFGETNSAKYYLAQEV